MTCMLGELFCPSWERGVGLLPVASKVCMENIARVLSSLDEEVQGEDPHASGHKAPPEDGGTVERGTLLYREEETPNGSSKSSGHTCH